MRSNSVGMSRIIPLFGSYICDLLEFYDPNRPLFRLKGMKLEKHLPLSLVSTCERPRLGLAGNRGHGRLTAALTDREAVPGQALPAIVALRLPLRSSTGPPPSKVAFSQPFKLSAFLTASL